MKTIKISKVDKLVSDWVRERAHWRCERCGAQFTPPTSGLHCSHYHGRGKKSVRFFPDNLTALCYGCHSYFDGAGREEYREFKIKQLGKKRFNILNKKAETLSKESIEIEKALSWLNSGE